MITMEPSLQPNLQENSYKMTEEDVKRLIHFRASNEVLFTGKRNSAKIAWSTILKGLGLEGKLTADQIAKKWDNLRTKYKDLKQPYQGQEHLGVVVESWPWFHIMDEAMQGRLFNSSLVLSPDSPSNAAHPPDCQPCQNQENTDILEFLIKTEMDETVTGEPVEEDEPVHAEAPPTGGVPMGWRRMTECTYKMTEAETERMIKLRAANEALFTGRKHSAKPAWRAILFELGLQGRLTTEQLAKKWDNLKRRYKELKFPSRGVEANPSSWPWFYRMNDAMEGRMANAAPILAPIVEDGDEECETLLPTPKKRARRSRGGMAEFLTESEMDLLVDNEEKIGSSALGDLHRNTEFTYKLTEDDTRRLIELRAANEVLFTGRRNTAKPAWRGIVKEMGLTGRITPDQVAKKWDNLKTKFKDLKFPPRGMEAQTNPASWPWFQLMSDALEGRLADKAPRVTPVWTSEEDAVFGSSPPPDCLMGERSGMSELDGMVGGDHGEADATVTYIDASGEECATPSELSYKRKNNVGSQCNVIRWFLQALTFFIILLFIVVIFLKLYNDQKLTDITKNVLSSSRDAKLGSNEEGPCSRKNVCPGNHIGFFVQSGAANVVPPKICVNNKLALGTVLNNADAGINIVVVNGKSGDVLKTAHFNMYSGEVEPLIEFLKNIEMGSVVLMAVFDEGSKKLNEEARTLISDLGSSVIHSLGYRDNWVFVGGKGTTGKSNFEKHMKSDESKNKYENWPEMVEMEGCIPKYV